MPQLSAISQLPFASEEFPQGSVIFREGQPCKAIYFVSSGSVELSIADRSGRKHVLRIAGAGDVLGLPAAMSSRPYSKSATVLTDATLHRIKVVDFLQALSRNPDLNMAVLKFLEVDSQAVQALRVRLLGRNN